MGYTKEQLAVVHHADGHAIVGAVAGSGKTHTMVARVIHLLKSGVEPRRILVLMFNKSAQEEFARRLKRACADEGLPVAEVQTFHGFGLRLAKRMVEAGLLNGAKLETEGYTIRKLAREVLLRVNAESGEDNQLDLNFDVVTEFLDTIDILKGELYPTPDERWAATLADVDKRFVRGFSLFEEARLERGIRLFSDLIYDPVMVALRNPEIQRFIGDRYAHVIIDEFQDINEAQMTLIRMIAGTRAFVMAVGDDDQTIYGWRGAKPEYMTSLFRKEFAGASCYTLPHTFRYGHSLSLLANFVITRNANRTDKICVSGIERKTALDVRLVTSNPGAEALKIVQEWSASGRGLHEVAILVREYAHSISSEVALLQARIPYRIVGAAPFFDRSDVLGLRAYLQLAAGGLAGIASFERRAKLVQALLTTPTLYLRRDMLESIAEAVAERPQDFLAIAERAFRNDTRALPFTRDRRLRALDTWRWAMSASGNKKAADLLGELLLKTNLQKEIEKNVPDPREAAEKIRMIGQIIRLARERGESPVAFVAFLDQLADDYGAAEGRDDRVLITSCHRAKGCEWPLVILPELTDGSFPVIRDGANDKAIEDERRLFYVATTRAQERLALISPMDQALIAMSKTGKSDPPLKPLASRFLYEANLSVAVEGLERVRKVNPDARCAAIIDRYRSVQ